MRRLPFTLVIAALAAFPAALAAKEACATTRLAVGAVWPLPQRPGGEFRPVYVTLASGSRWEPTDGAFREPIYTTPRGYIYRAIRGYDFRRTDRAAGLARKKRHAACITDIGHGPYARCD